MSCLPNPGRLQRHARLRPARTRCAPLVTSHPPRPAPCWLELPAAELDAAPAGVTALVERELTALLRLRYGRGAAS